MATFPEQRCVLSLYPFILVFILLGLSPHTACGQECLYRYLRQPPSAIIGPCNPYTNFLKLECQVSVPAFLGPQTEIQWFHNDQQITNISFAPVQSISPVVNSTNDPWIITSVITLTNLRDEQSGNYHCDVAIDTNLNVTSTPSNKFLLLTQDPHYIINAHRECRDIQFVDSDICGGAIPSTTTEPVEETSPPSSTPTSPSLTPSPTPPPAPLPTSSQSTTSSTTPSQTGKGSPLQLWVYVLVAVAAIFGMIIVVLAILCVGLCLKKNKKTTDSFKQKDVEFEQFSSNSMVPNGLYQQKDESGVTSSTHFTANTLSDYNTLGERDYEVVDVADSNKRDYHHLQRPSPPMVPNGRNATFSFIPPKQAFHSMSTLTSQTGGTKGTTRDPVQQEGLQTSRVYSKSASEGPDGHLYRELEDVSPNPDTRPGGHVGDIYRSPTLPPNSANSAHLFNEGGISFDNPNESLYSPSFEASQLSRVQPGGLENMPETGTMFVEPSRPTAFPVHKYEKIQDGSDPQYETPIITRKKNGPSTSSPITNKTNNGGEIRPRTSSGARYETEVQPSFVPENPYHKLVRLSEDNGTPKNGSSPAVNPAVYSELSSASLNLKTSANESMSSQTTDSEITTIDEKPGNFPEKFSVLFPLSLPADLSNGFTSPIYRPPDITTPTESMSAYRTRSQEEKGAVNTEAFKSPHGVDSPTKVNEVPHHASVRRNISEDRPATSSHNVLQNLQRRAWSEERSSGSPNVAKSSSLTMTTKPQNRTLNEHQQGQRLQSSNVPKVYKDLRVNGLDPRVGEFMRSKTTV